MTPPDSEAVFSSDGQELFVSSQLYLQLLEYLTLECEKVDCSFTLEISTELLTDCKEVHDFQVLYCFCLAVYIVILVFSLGYNLTIFDM